MRLFGPGGRVAAEQAAVCGPFDLVDTPAPRRAYSEDQARDYHGRFGEGDGGSHLKGDKAQRPPGTLTKKGVTVADGKSVKVGDPVRVRYEVGLPFDRFTTTGTGKIVETGQIHVGVKFDDGSVRYFKPDDVFKDKSSGNKDGKVDGFLFGGHKVDMDALIQVATQVFGPTIRPNDLGDIDLTGIGDLGRMFGGSVSPLFGAAGRVRVAYSEDQPRDAHGRFGEGHGEATGKVLDGGKYTTSYAARNQPPDGMRKGDSVVYHTATGSDQVWHAFGDPKSEPLGYVGRVRNTGEGVEAAGFRVAPKTFSDTESAVRYLLTAPHTYETPIKPGAQETMSHTFGPGPYAKTRGGAAGVDVFVGFEPDEEFYAGTVIRAADGALRAEGVRIAAAFFRPHEEDEAVAYLVDEWTANANLPLAAAVYIFPGQPLPARVAYTEDQPRDAHGRFGEGSGGTVTHDEMQAKISAWAHGLPHAAGTMFTVMPRDAFDAAKQSGTIGHAGGQHGFWVTNNPSAEYVHGPGDVVVALQVHNDEFLGGGHGGDFKIQDTLPFDRVIGSYRVRDTVSDPVWPGRRVAYTEDQPRDAHGRFGEGGGDTKTAESGHGPQPSERGAEAGADVAAIATSDTWGSLESPNPHAPPDWGQTTNPDWGQAANASSAALERAGFNAREIELAVGGWSWGNTGTLRDVAAGKENEYYGQSKVLDDIMRDRMVGYRETVELARSTEVHDPLYRSMSADRDAVIGGMQVGQSFDGDHLSSWSRNELVAQIFGDSMTNIPVNMTMRADAGAHGLDIATLGKDDLAWQQEVMVAAESFRVVEREYITDDFDQIQGVNLVVEPSDEPAPYVAALSLDEQLFSITFAQWGLAHGKINPDDIPPEYRAPGGAQAVTTIAPMRAYSEDQPRDAHGRFGEGGASAETTTKVTDTIGTIFGRIAKPDEGGTIDLVTGQSPVSGFMVGREGVAQAVPLGQFTASRDGAVQIVADYIRAHAADFDQPGAMLGLWHNPETGNVVLDVSENVADRAQAVRLGAENDQISVYDVVRGELIPTGGSGGGQAAIPEPRARSAAQTRQRHDGRGSTGTRRAGSRRDLAARVKRARRLVERLANIRRDAVRDLRAGAEIAFAEALRQAGVRAISKTKNRQGNAAAATVATAFENHRSLQPFFAALGVTEADLLAGSFGTYRDQAEDWLRQYREQQRAEVEDSGMDPDLVIVEDAARDVAAVAFIVAALQALARNRLLGADPVAVPGEVSGTVPPQIIIRAMRIADGLAVPQFGASADVMPELVDTGIASLIERVASALRADVLDDLKGELRARETEAQAQTDLDTAAQGLNVDDLATAIEGVEAGPATEYVWVHGFYGDPKTDFEPHADLDGISSTDPENDPVFLNDGDWPEDTTPAGNFYPGDHLGCSCELVAQVPEGTEALADLIA